MTEPCSQAHIIAKLLEHQESNDHWQERQNGTLDRMDERLANVQSTVTARMDRLELLLTAKIDSLSIKLTNMELREQREQGQRSTALAILQWLGPMGLATILVAVFSYFNVF